LPLLTHLLRRLRHVRDLEREIGDLRAEVAHWKTWMSPGHFYSPIPNADEVRKRESELFGEPPRTLPGIDLREDAQLALVDQLKDFYGEMPFPRVKSDSMRYWFDNWAYSYGDAILLYSMLRHVRPRRVIEIGSGFSSAAMLDTNERFLDRATALTFIDPDPSTVRALLKPEDTAEIIAKPVQDVPLSRFDELEADDFLFVDSTHVAKTGSDVNRILFDILPRLKDGVWVHFHDMFYPFEYPKEWVYEGRAWNEDYIVRAFLEFNAAFRIELFATYLARFHRDWFARHMPLCLENPGGALWIRKKG
jgi:predicted O-methyltransferase YrrM